MNPKERQRSSEELDLSAQDLRNWKWIPQYFRGIVASADAALFLGGGLLVGFLAEYFKKIDVDGPSELFAIAGLGVAALAVTLTALSIFVTLVNDAYLRILALNEESKGIKGFVVPYIASAFISTLSILVGVIGAVAYKAVAQWAHATFLGLGAGLILWAIWGLFQITVGVAVHGVNRYRVAEDQFKSEEGRGLDIESSLNKAASKVNPGNASGASTDQPSHHSEGSIPKANPGTRPDSHDDDGTND